MVRVKCIYAAHMTEIAQTYEKQLEFNGTTLKDLIDVLNAEHEGFREELLDPETGEFGSRNVIFVQRGEANTRNLYSLGDEIQDGDILTFF
jgi:molybdopterin converting factor small subunit